ncbi:MAG: CAP domain-containing protein [Anaerolineales bacterium]
MARSKVGRERPHARPNRKQRALYGLLLVLLALFPGSLTTAGASVESSPPLGVAPYATPQRLSAPTNQEYDVFVYLPLVIRAPAGLYVDPTSRSASRAFFDDHYRTSEGVPAGWTGDHATCGAGSTSEAFREAILQRINYFRAMAGLPGNVDFDPSYNEKAQAAALIMSANGDLSHTPDPGWACYSAAGVEAAGKSNLYLGRYGPDAITGYMKDPGAGNGAAGHRRWILYPRQEALGTGDVPPVAGYASSNALYVLGTFGERPEPRDGFVAWPPPGYVPYPVVFPRWSFSYPNADFSGAGVAMSSGGSSISVVLEALGSGYGDNTLVWRPYAMDSYASWPQPTADITYTVEISNVLISSSAYTFTYDVIVFDPAS